MANLVNHSIKKILLGISLAALMLPSFASAARTSIDWVNLSGTTYIQPNYPNGMDLLIYGANHYINFNAVTSSSGYGFRDNAGTMEFKNSGGAWTSLGVGGTGITGLGSGFATTTAGAITLATSTLSFNGLTIGQTIAPSASSILFTPTVSGTLNNSGLTNSSITVNSTSISLGSSGTITAATSTLLGDSSTFSGSNLFSASTTFSTQINLRNASTSLETLGTLWLPNLTAYNLIAADANSKVVATSSIGNSLLANSAVTVNTNSPLGGGGPVSLGGTLTLTCSTCSTATAANPTGTTGLSAVNGSATTYMRSDGAPALSQAITPTWTALHIFSANASSTQFSSFTRSYFGATATTTITSQGLIGAATSTPFWLLTAASSTGPQIGLTDGTASSNAWTIRSISNTLYIATSTAIATSTTAAITVNQNGVVTIPNGIQTNASSTLANTTISNASTTNLSASTYLGTPVASAILSTDSSKTAQATTLSTGAFSYSSPTLSGVDHPCVTLTGTTTNATGFAAIVGTTTIPLESGFGETWNTATIFTDTGFLDFDVTSAGNHLDFKIGSSTNGTTAFTSNNTMTTGNKVLLNYGSGTSTTYANFCVKRTI